MSASPQDSRNARRLRKAARLDRHQHALRIIRGEAGLKIRDGVQCAVLHLTHIFIASDCRLDPEPGTPTYECLCEACLALEEAESTAAPPA